MKKAKVIVRLKEGILDPQGETVTKALNRLGFVEVEKVRFGKLIEIELGGEGDLVSQVEKMCQKLLANPVTENYSIEVEED